MKTLFYYVSKSLMSLMVIVLLPVFAYAEASDMSTVSAAHYERLDRLKAMGLLKEIDLTNDFLSTELREAISNVIVCLPSALMYTNGGYTAISYEVVSIDQDSTKTTVAINLFSMTYYQDHEKLYLIGYEATPWRLIFKNDPDKGDFILSTIQTPWDTVEGSDFSYDDAIDMYWAGNTNSYPGLAINAWLEIDGHMRNSSKEQDFSDLIIIQHNTVPDSLLRALEVSILPIKVRPTWPHAMYDSAHDVLTELSTSNDPEFTINVLSVDGEFIDKATFILHEDGSLSFVTMFSNSSFAQE